MNVFTLTHHLNLMAQDAMHWPKTSIWRSAHRATITKHVRLNARTRPLRTHTLSFLNELTGMFFLHWEVLLITQRIFAGYLYALRSSSVFAHCYCFHFDGLNDRCLFQSVEVMRRRGCECRAVKCIQRPWSFLCARKQ